MQLSGMTSTIYGIMRRCVSERTLSTESDSCKSFLFISEENLHFRGASVPKMTSQNKPFCGNGDNECKQGNLQPLLSNSTRIPGSPLRGSSLPQSDQQLPHSLLDMSTLKVHLPNGTFNVVRFGDAADIKGIIQLLTNRLYTSGECRYYQHLYAMRMVNTVTGDVHWLHQDTTMFQVSVMIY